MTQALPQLIEQAACRHLIQKMYRHGSDVFTGFRRQRTLGTYFIMRSLFTLFLVLLFTSTANAKEYGTYDPKRLVNATETPAGKKFDFEVGYLDQILNDLSAHAKNYPPQFDSPQDQQRAIRDVVTVSGMLDFLINVPNPNPELLGRAAYLSSLGHNLNIKGAAERANSLFQRLLTIAPSDPRANYMYGTFLAGASKPKEALPYLEKAMSAGVIDAAFAIGMSYLTIGDKEQALKNLEDYKRRKPSDENVEKVIEAIRNGKVEFKKEPG